MNTDTIQNDLTAEFALTCPTLLNGEHRAAPFLAVQEFFHFSSPSGYRKKLVAWFKNAMSDGIKYENASDLLFVHNQFLRLANAGYLISKGNFSYLHNAANQKFAHWLVAISATPDTEVQLLEPSDRERPLRYIHETLTIEAITKIRFGMLEWLETALTESDSLELDHEYTYDLFELLQKIVEAFYLIMTAPAKAQSHGD